MHTSDWACPAERERGRPFLNLYVGEGGIRIILDPLCGRRVSEEPVRYFSYLLGYPFQRNALLARKEEFDAQAVIDEGRDLSLECLVQRTLTGRYPAPDRLPEGETDGAERTLVTSDDNLEESERRSWSITTLTNALERMQTVFRRVSQAKGRNRYLSETHTSYTSLLVRSKTRRFALSAVLPKQILKRAAGDYLSVGPIEIENLRTAGGLVLLESMRWMRGNSITKIR